MLATEVQERVFQTEDGCWLWEGGYFNHGYGRIREDGKDRLAHRVVYEALVGPIPDGLEIDHLCRQTACVNPQHLEPVTHQENIRRGAAAREPVAECLRGHPFTDDNTYRDVRGSRYCRECAKLRTREWRARKSEGD